MAGLGKDNFAQAMKLMGNMMAKRIEKDFLYMAALEKIPMQPLTEIQAEVGAMIEELEEEAMRLRQLADDVEYHYSVSQVAHHLRWMADCADLGRKKLMQGIKDDTTKPTRIYWGIDPHAR